MERNKEYYYSYAQGSDDNISCDLMSNVNFVDYMHENDDDDDFEDDEESEEDEEDEEDHTDRESSEDDSRVDKFGYLVDKSTPSAEVNNNSSDSSDIGVKSKKLNGITDSVNDFSDSVGEKFIENGPIDHQDVQNGKLYGEKRLLDLRTQVSTVVYYRVHVCCILWSEQFYIAFLSIKLIFLMCYMYCIYCS